MTEYGIRPHRRRTPADVEQQRRIADVIARSSLGAPLDLARLEAELAAWAPPLDTPEIAAALGLTATPIPGGYCVKTLDAHRCVDVLDEMYSVRLAVTFRDIGAPHTGYEQLGPSWRYFAHGRTSAGTPRTKRTAFTAALHAVSLWAGDGDPPNFDKIARR